MITVVEIPGITATLIASKTLVMCECSDGCLIPLCADGQLDHGNNTWMVIPGTNIFVPRDGCPRRVDVTGAHMRIVVPFSDGLGWRSVLRPGAPLALLQDYFVGPTRAWALAWGYDDSTWVHFMSHITDELIESVRLDGLLNRLDVSCDEKHVCAYTRGTTTAKVFCGMSLLRQDRCPHGIYATAFTGKDAEIVYCLKQADDFLSIWFGDVVVPLCMTHRTMDFLSVTCSGNIAAVSTSDRTAFVDLARTRLFRYVSHMHPVTSATFLPGTTWFIWSICNTETRASVLYRERACAWTCLRHHLFSARERAIIRQLLLVAGRLKQTGDLPHLPVEVWQMCIYPLVVDSTF
jgi:hypothetical protein